MHEIEGMGSTSEVANAVVTAVGVGGAGHIAAGAGTVAVVAR